MKTCQAANSKTNVATGEYLAQELVMTKGTLDGVILLNSGLINVVFLIIDLITVCNSKDFASSDKPTVLCHCPQL